MDYRYESVNHFLRDSVASPQHYGYAATILYMPTLVLMATDLGRRIVMLRKSKDMSQGKLAYLAEVEVTWLSGVETGRSTKPDPHLLVRVARVLGTNVEYLITGVEPGGADPVKMSRIRRLLARSDEQLQRLERALDAFLYEDAPDLEERPGGTAEPPSTERSRKRTQRPPSADPHSSG